MPLQELTSTFFLVFGCRWRRSGGRFRCSTFNASRRRHYACNIATNASINTAHSAAKHPDLMASLRWRFNYFCNRINALFPHRLHLHQLQGCGLIDLCKAQIGYIMHLYRHCTGNQTTRPYHTATRVTTPELFTYSFIINSKRHRELIYRYHFRIRDDVLILTQYKSRTSPSACFAWPEWRNHVNRIQSHNRNDISRILKFHLHITIKWIFWPTKIISEQLESAK